MIWEKRATDSPTVAISQSAKKPIPATEAIFATASEFRALWEKRKHRNPKKGRATKAPIRAKLAEVMGRPVTDYTQTKNTA